MQVDQTLGLLDANCVSPNVNWAASLVSPQLGDTPSARNRLVLSEVSQSDLKTRRQFNIFCSVPQALRASTGCRCILESRGTQRAFTPC